MEWHHLITRVSISDKVGGKRTYQQMKHRTLEIH